MLRTVDLTPSRVNLLGYQGDPFDWQIRLKLDDGSPADVLTWQWQAWVRTRDGGVIPWLWEPQADGVDLYLRGQDTARLPAQYCPFDVTGRQPDAGEGITVVRGKILAYARITPPLRGRAPGAVDPHTVTVPA